MACEVFSKELNDLRMVAMSSESKSATTTTITPFMNIVARDDQEDKLPLLVMTLCQQIAQLKTHQKITYSSLSHQRQPIDDDRAKDVYRDVLLQTYQAFTSECDLFSQSLETSCPSCLAKGLMMVIEKKHSTASSPSSSSSSMGMPGVVAVLVQRNGAKQAIHIAADADTLPAPDLTIHPLSDDAQLAAAAGSIILTFEALVSPSLRIQLYEAEALALDSLQPFGGRVGGESISGRSSSSSSIDAQWLSDFFRSLTPSLRSSIPQLIDCMRALSSRPALLDHLTSMDHYTHETLDNYTRSLSLRHDDSAIDRGGSFLSYISPCTATMLTQRIVVALRKQLRRCELILLLLHLLQDIGSGFMSTSVLYDINNKYLPKVGLASS